MTTYTDYAVKLVMIKTVTEDVFTYESSTSK